MMVVGGGGVGGGGGGMCGSGCVAGWVGGGSRPRSPRPSDESNPGC